MKNRNTPRKDRTEFRKRQNRTDMKNRKTVLAERNAGRDRT